MDIPTSEDSFSEQHLPSAAPRLPLGEGAPPTAAHACPPSAEPAAAPRPAGVHGRVLRRARRPAPPRRACTPPPPRPACTPPPPRPAPPARAACRPPFRNSKLRLPETPSPVEGPGSSPGALLARGRRRRPGRPGRAAEE